MVVFLKLGGSLITDKNQPFKARLDTIKRTAQEIKKAFEDIPGLKLILGHGSGSFGHFAAMESHFENKASTAKQWQSFQKVWMAARDLNNIVVDQFHKSGLAVIALPPSASVVSYNKTIREWNAYPLKTALENNLIPIIFGDTVFDHTLGGVIQSTEELFLFLINQFKPDKIILAGKEPGVWADYPENKNLITKITPSDIYKINNNIKESRSIDVTGGMQRKVQLMIEALTKKPDLSIEIISGDIPGNIYKSLKGLVTGTQVLIQ